MLPGLRPPLMSPQAIMLTLEPVSCSRNLEHLNGYPLVAQATLTSLTWQALTTKIFQHTHVNLLSASRRKLPTNCRPSVVRFFSNVELLPAWYFFIHIMLVFWMMTALAAGVYPVPGSTKSHDPPPFLCSFMLVIVLLNVHYGDSNFIIFAVWFFTALWVLKYITLLGYA